MENNKFNHWSETKYLKELVTNPLITVGDYSYYSGYYGHHNFEDGCVRYMWGDSTSRALFNPIETFSWQVDRLIIGNYVCIASGVIILMGGNHNHHPEWVTVYPFLETIEESYVAKGDTIIESDAWIGMNAMIMPGVRIGQGAIVAAGSVVVKDVPAYTIVGGNPAKIIKERFTTLEISMLKEIRWYDWPRTQVEAAVPLLMSGNIAGLHQFYHSNRIN